MDMNEALDIFHKCYHRHAREHDCRLCPLNCPLGLPLMPDYKICGVIEDLDRTLSNLKEAK